MEDSTLKKINMMSANIRSQEHRIDRIDQVLNGKIKDFDLAMSYVPEDCNPALKKQVNFELNEITRTFLQNIRIEEDAKRLNYIDKLTKICKEINE